MSVEIPLYYAVNQSRKPVYKVVGFAVADEDDAARAMNFRWGVFTSPRNRTRYARRMVWRNGHRHEVRLHNFIMGEPPEGYLWDHADLDGLNNRRGNLRLATVGQNHTNRKIQRNNSIGYKGVIAYKHTAKFGAAIGWEGKRVYLGVFEGHHEAAFAYNIAAAHLYGEFARPNSIGLGDTPSVERREEVIGRVLSRLNGVNICSAGKGKDGQVTHQHCFACLATYPLSGPAEPSGTDS